MTAASGTDAGTKRPSWFAQRWTIVADGEPPAGSPVRRAWWPLILPRWLGAISEPAAGPPKKFILVDKLDGASKWAAAGFSSVTALLLFFGVKEGVLDQAIRLDPFATLCVFMLLGAMPLR